MAVEKISLKGGPDGRIEQHAVSDLHQQDEGMEAHRAALAPYAKGPGTVEDLESAHSMVHNLLVVLCITGMKVCRHTELLWHLMQRALVQLRIWSLHTAYFIIFLLSCAPQG